MSTEREGETLIFLISQPRAGSTLLQRILGSHPDIHTVSEPWLMLHPLYALRDNGYQAEYAAHLARVGLREFLRTLKGDEEEYLEGIRRMYGYLYGRALAESGKKYFLDKTPRYYFIIPELSRTFPRARFIILLRNPLAVLCSMITWVNQKWYSLYRLRHDLLRAPGRLVHGIELLGQRCTVVHYESLVNEPEREVSLICEKLGIPFIPEMIEYGHHDLPRWRFGDQRGVYNYDRPTAENAEKWKTMIEDLQVWRLADEYIEMLGKDLIERMGYAYEGLREWLDSHRPSRLRLALTCSLDELIKKPVEERRQYEWNLLRLARSLQQRGINGTIIAMMRKISRAVARTERASRVEKIES